LVKRKLIEEEKRTGNSFDENDVNVETEADKVLKRFVQVCHEKKMGMIMDFVPNHCHEKHPFFQEALNRKGHRDWFYFNEEGYYQNYLKFMNFGELPK